MKRISLPKSLLSLRMRLGLDVILVIIIALTLLINFFHLLAIPQLVFIVLSILGLLSVLGSALSALVKKELTIDLLASVALIFSLLAREWQSAAFINLMLSSARIFDGWTDIRTRDIISHLLKLRPATVKLKERHKIVVKPLERVKIGDQIFIEAGERVPIDGMVISGQASIDESILTGESEPVTKKAGDQIFEATLNTSGSLIAQITKEMNNSTLMRMVKLVDQASRKKSPTEKMASKFTQWYILLTLLGALFLYFYLHNLSLVLSALLVVCADDIAVAIPLTFTSAIALAARRGILIKGTNVLENLPKVAYIITDKTGTLTMGKPTIIDIVLTDKTDRADFLTAAALAAQASTHPVNKAILELAHKENLTPPSPDSAQETPGEGIEVKYTQKVITLGKIEFLKEQAHLKIPAKIDQEIEKRRANGFGVTALAINQKLLGFVVLSDKIKPDAKEIISETKKLGVISWIMLTGDNVKIAKRVATEVGIDSYHAGLKPEQKLKYLQDFSKLPQEKMAMIGDGINDAATLAMADVSIAMGAIGSDVAIEAADIALMNDKLDRVLEAIILAKQTKRVAQRNFLIWGLTNGVGLMLVFAGVLNPAGAAAYNFATDFIPIANALSLNGFRLSQTHS